MSNQKVIEALEHSLNCASEPHLRAQLAAAIRRLRAPAGRPGSRRRAVPTLRGHTGSAKGAVGRHGRGKQKPRGSSGVKVLRSKEQP
jgi:hypothetical protein